MAGGRDVSVVPLDLQSADTNVILTFTDRPVVLRGAVRTAKGSPDTAAQVMAFPTDVTSSTFEPSLRRLRSARVSTSGTYEIAGLPPGEYFVIAAGDEASVDFPSPALIRTLARSATRVKIAETGDVTQDLTTVIAR
jgi:sarcosine oxidase gamma subunit